MRILSIILFSFIASSLYAQDGVEIEEATKAKPAKQIYAGETRTGLETIIHPRWLVHLNDALDFAAKFERPIEATPVGGMKLKFTKDKKTLLIYKAHENSYLYRIIINNAPEDNSSVIITKEDHLDKSRILMVQNMDYLITHDIINLVLQDFGFSKENFIAAGYILKQLRHKDFTPEYLKIAGYNLEELLEEYTISRLRTAGFTAAEFKELDYDEGFLRAAGFTVEDLEAAGY